MTMSDFMKNQKMFNVIKKCCFKAMILNETLERQKVHCLYLKSESDVALIHLATLTLQ